MRISALYWVVYSRRLSIPPHPEDLEYLLDGEFWLKDEIHFSIEWLDAYRRMPRIVKWCLEWTHEPPYDIQKATEGLEDLNGTMMERWLDGWLMRHIVESSLERWRDPSLIYLKHNAIEDTRNAVNRLLQLDNIVQSFDLYISVDTEFLQQFPKLAIIATRVRQWRYQEIYVIRHELWQRWSCSHLQLLDEFHAGNMAWQRCWEGDFRVLETIHRSLQPQLPKRLPSPPESRFTCLSPSSSSLPPSSIGSYSDDDSSDGLSMGSPGR